MMFTELPAGKELLMRRSWGGGDSEGVAGLGDEVYVGNSEGVAGLGGGVRGGNSERVTGQLRLGGER